MHTPESRVEQWRAWAQFVYCGGGPASATDRELQQRVCEAHDSEIRDLQTKVNYWHAQAQTTRWWQAVLALMLAVLWFVIGYLSAQEIR